MQLPHRRSTSSALVDAETAATLVHRPGTDRLCRENDVAYDETDTGGGRRLGGGVIASLAGATTLVVFMFQNREDVSVDFLFLRFIWPLWLVTLVSAVAGALVWVGLGVLRRRQRRKTRRDER